VCGEIARAVLPQSMYTTLIETGSLAAYARLCHLRLGDGAQKEIKAYATLISGIMEKAFPVSWAELMKHGAPTPPQERASS